MEKANGWNANMESHAAYQLLRPLRQQKLKQRTLAVHLANYSTNNADEFKDFTMKEVEIFISVADCEDPRVCGATVQ